MPFFGPFLKYADFSGRATRLEFWTFTLLNGVVALILWMLAWQSGSWWPIVLVFLYGLVALLPTWAVWVRRLLDTGRSGWSLLWSLVPLFGAVILYVFALLGSDDDNEYGPAP